MDELHGESESQSGFALFRQWRPFTFDASLTTRVTIPGLSLVRQLPALLAGVECVQARKTSINSREE